MARSGKKTLLKRFFSVLGPALVTGAADNDPSGIATYSIAGAQLGMSLLWTAFATWPLMAFVQFMCARIGMVTGRGLAGALRQVCPRWLLFIAAAALLGANVVTIGADLAGMSDAGQMLTGINSNIESSRQVAEALQPLAGHFAATLYKSTQSKPFLGRVLSMACSHRFFWLAS